jgi:hypothetical protein
MMLKGTVAVIGPKRKSPRMKRNILIQLVELKVCLMMRRLLQIGMDTYGDLPLIVLVHMT